MGRVVYKYPLQSGTGLYVLKMPRGAQLLAVQMQGNTPCVWALVDKERPLTKRRLLVVGTGWDMPAEPVTYVGTFQTEGGMFVWHVFDLGEAS